ncbi:mitochondrial import inner membrane translocase subunit tim17, putative [Ichthyophthirius multifiliis]|uniref:Mitochondrial import inner membrane translocase subunit tim17, putative n=1 Tax=Ichthyophthirius multifiliis TaxID=5932 RepID=G0QQ55_ICHMU|nr:mitochondrial import inner membrane translocase subunit tim17, putative [Ichthyophthirius multifiliis]EGR32651.1 mitochondrial import inner membrane translocase subunit tim17, putative [Ichthyophthirius multifiliis]|eukprot:XP_004036637.1 mitochondrial import inner membrane translocase subunit tim17, putative [Ichthyophthirius multifiliis]
MIGDLPCPYRVVDDIGGAYAMGCVAGCVIYFLKGMYYAPSSERFSQGFDLLRKRAPILGGLNQKNKQNTHTKKYQKGNFAIWGGLYTSTECILIYIRQVEDFWNRIAGGFITGATLAIRGGYKTSLQQGIFGGLFLGSFSLVEIAMMKMQKKQEQEHWQQMYEEQIKIQTEHLKQTRPGIYFIYLIQYFFIFIFRYLC